MEALTLSGGATNGFIILGALQYLADTHRLQSKDVLVGTSVGSMICYLLAIGYTPVEIMVYLCTHHEKIFGQLRMSIKLSILQGKGALDYSPIENALVEMTLSKIESVPTLKELYEKTGKTLVCVSYNYSKNIPAIFSHATHPTMLCTEALRMSSNLPLIFDIVKHDGCIYFDGGIANNFAIDVAEQYAEHVLGLYLTHSHEEMAPDEKINVLELVYKLLLVPIDQNTKGKIKTKRDTTLVVPLELDENVKIFTFDISEKRKLDMFSKGYNSIHAYFSSSVGSRASPCP